VRANRRVLLKGLEEQFILSHGTIWDIVYERLGYRKVCIRWVPRQLTEDHKKNRTGASLTHLLRFNYHGEDFLGQIITGDETWAHQYCPETKAQSMTWNHPGSPTIKKFKTSISSRKLMASVFRDMHGVLLLYFSPPNETVNSLCLSGHSHTHTHARTHARTYARTHAPTCAQTHHNAHLHAHTHKQEAADVRQEGAVVA
jgi:hypothetical protein